MQGNIFAHLLGIIIVIYMAFFAGLDWYVGWPLGLVIAGITIIFGGKLLGRLRGRDDNEF